MTHGRRRAQPGRSEGSRGRHPGRPDTWRDLTVESAAVMRRYGAARASRRAATVSRGSAWAAATGVLSSRLLSGRAGDRLVGAVGARQPAAGGAANRALFRLRSVRHHHEAATARSRARPGKISPWASASGQHAPGEDDEKEPTPECQAADGRLGCLGRVLRELRAHVNECRVRDRKKRRSPDPAGRDPFDLGADRLQLCRGPRVPRRSITALRTSSGRSKSVGPIDGQTGTDTR